MLWCNATDECLTKRQLNRIVAESESQSKTKNMMVPLNASLFYKPAHTAPCVVGGLGPTRVLSIVQRRAIEKPVT